VKPILSFSSLRLATTIGLGVAVLTGCGGSDHRDLQQFVDNTRKQAAATSTIEPLPDIKPYETYLYASVDQRDPFTPSTAADEAPADVAVNGIRPDPNRRREALESYPLDSLRMVGTLDQGDRTWAIVQVINDPDAGIHRVNEGNYMGQNHGRIVGISEDQIKLIEIIPDGLGGWRERESSVALSEE
jgi:type IV pilus assembly protein PilP